MIDHFEADGRQSETSLWPIFVAFGITLSELGILFGIRFISVVGLLLFVGSVAGTLHESGYISRPGRAVGVQGLVLVGIGLALIAVNQTGSTVRGQSITVAGLICLLTVPLRLAFYEPKS